MGTFKASVIQGYLGTTSLVRAWHSAGRKLRRAKRKVVFYHRVDDPYSLLTALALQRAALPDLNIEVVTVPEPAADADPEPQLRAAYARVDAMRLAQVFGLPLGLEDAPITQERLRRANAVMLVEREGTEALNAAVDVSAALLSGDHEALQSAVSSYGVARGQDVRPKLESNYARLRKDGHYQSAMLHYEGEWYFGLDRFGLLVERLAGEGVTHHSPLYRREPARPAADTIFFSYRSPYSYLALEQLECFERVPQLKPLLPMVMRGLPVSKVKARALVKDAAREAKRLGIPFGKIADPLGEGVERALAVHMAAAERGVDLHFAQRMMRAIWSEGRDVSDATTLKALAAEVGLGAADVDAALASDEWRVQTEANRAALRAVGHYGVPTFVKDGGVFWGQDRIGFL